MFSYDIAGLPAKIPCIACAAKISLRSIIVPHKKNRLSNLVKVAVNDSGSDYKFGFV